MLNPTEKDERQYLEDVKRLMQETLERISAKVQAYAREIQQQKAYLWENKTGMDHVEKIDVRRSVDQQVLTAEAVADQSKRIRKLLRNPYFGRFDFTPKETQEEQPIYIGIHGFVDEEKGARLIHDWRAPISTLFYDYETGPAHFDAPDGRVFGEIQRKRQYRIRNGAMDFMIETDLNIHDDILQKELSQRSDEKMKNIVATIQRDQNAIIRNENSQVLIIQGVAGSGKTSIALHRIAFMLYRFKDDISAQDILIVSPNKVFADYISSVLPELGEENMPEIGIEELANDLLDREFKFQSFFEQVTRLLERTDKAYEKRIQSKASHDFLKQLDDYIAHVEASYFQAHDMTVNGKPVPEWFMRERFESYHYLPIQGRLNKIAKDIEVNVANYYHYNVTPEERAKIKNEVKKMFRVTTLRALYKDFYEWMGEPQLLKFVKGSVFEYSDVYPLVYLKMRWDGLKTFDHVKHLLIDEMQDYTPVQYAVIAKLFPCKKTILGDANQSVNPFSSSSADKIRQIFPDSETVKLNTSYRSTYEITQFAQGISPNSDLQPIERHGSQPTIEQSTTEEEEFQSILAALNTFKESEHNSLGIIMRTQEQAQSLFDQLKQNGEKVYLLSSQSDAFRQGALVCTAHMSKGLEFDHVIVPQVTASNYKSEMDRKILYVACTRAMHDLTLTATGSISSFLKQ